MFNDIFIYYFSGLLIMVQLLQPEFVCYKLLNIKNALGNF